MKISRNGFTVDTDTRGVGERGKIAEGKVDARLKVLCKSQQRAYWRMPDPRAGSRKKSIADFMVMDDRTFYLIEAKETYEDHRLPYGNFDESNVGTLKVWEMAGAQVIVLVYHTNLDAWRIFPLSRFTYRPLRTENGKAIGSWFFHDDAKPQPLEALLK